MAPMTLDSATCYRALRSRDARFDGRFFVAVSSTRIYCRPVCTVKPPRRENCRFYPSAAAAESAGYRPCLRCRPELAPGNASVDATTRVAQAAASLIEDRALDVEGLEAVAARLGITDRHLRRAFGAEFGVSPVEYAQTQRLLLAKRLLTDTALPVTEIAFASGFGSLRRFNALFKQRYRLQPQQLRRHMRAQTAPAADALQFELSFRPPYDWPALAAFLGARAIAGVEAVEGGVYRRTARVVLDGKEHRGWIEAALSPKKPALRVAVSASLARVLPPVLSRVKALMDLSCNPTEVAQALGALAGQHPGMRVPGAFDGFEVAVRAILGQQVSVAAARTLAGRLVARAGARLTAGPDGITHLFPTPAALAAGDLEGLGLTGGRRRALQALGTAVADGRLDLGAPAEAVVNGLTALPGIGSWTAQYVALRSLSEPDAFPDGDLVLRRAAGARGVPLSARALTARAEAWRPWRGYAVFHLWSAAGEAAVRKEG
jgi:AraC family transcriptional regulator of adaptative response / DNA-3-methyladenine glycosylase II